VVAGSRVILRSSYPRIDHHTPRGSITASREACSNYGEAVQSNASYAELGMSVGPRPRSSIVERGTYAQCNFCWGTKIESTVRYLSVEVDDALEIAERIEVSITGAELPQVATVKRCQGSG